MLVVGSIGSVGVSVIVIGTVEESESDDDSPETCAVAGKNVITGIKMRAVRNANTVACL
jgi:hypothetical protein